MTIRPLLTAILLAVALSPHARAAVQDVGFWEEDGVRAAFHRKGSVWQTRRTHASTDVHSQGLPLIYASPRSWHLNAAPGGVIKTAPFPAYDFAWQVGLQKVLSAPDVNRVSSDEYPTVGHDTNPRPALVTDTKVKSPAIVETDAASRSGLALARKAYVRKWHDKISFYKDSSFKKRDSARKILETDFEEVASFTAGDKSEIVGLQLGGEKVHAKCKMPGRECRALLPQWFLLKGGRAVALGDGQNFLEAADVNGNGKPLYFLLINRVTGSGYALVTPTGQRTEFVWTE